MIIAMDDYELLDENWMGTGASLLVDPNGGLCVSVDLFGVSNLWAPEAAVMLILREDGKLGGNLKFEDVAYAVCEWRDGRVPSVA